MQAVAVDPGTVLKVIHILGASVLFGTGLGTAFYIFRAWRIGDIDDIASTARAVVVADFAFTTPAVVIQPLTGILLAGEYGYALDQGWIVASLALYLLIGALWLPVVWLQSRLARLAAAAREAGTSLPDRFHTLMRIWFALGWPAFASLIAIVWLMVAKPDI